MQLHIQNSQSVNPDAPEVVHGRGLAHRKLSRKQWLSLAADLATGQCRLDPSLGQISAITGMPVAAIRAEIKARTARNGNGNGHAIAIEAFVQAWHAWSDSERDAVVKALGIGTVWDTISRVIV
jgi:hypothetical protein